MKYLYIIILVLPLALFGYGVDVNKISKQIDRLKSSKRVSASLDYDVYDPFATAKPLLKQKQIKHRKHHKKVIRFQTILNDMVLIKNRWYRVGDKVYGYKITKIGRDSILISKKGKIRRISGAKKKEFIQVTKEIKE